MCQDAAAVAVVVVVDDDDDVVVAGRSGSGGEPCEKHGSEERSSSTRRIKAVSRLTRRYMRCLAAVSKWTMSMLLVAVAVAVVVSWILSPSVQVVLGTSLLGDSVRRRNTPLRLRVVQF